MNHILEAWLLEYDIPAAAANPDPTGGQAPAMDPNAGMVMGNDPNVANQQSMMQGPGQPPPQQPQQGPPPDQEDPQNPDMPEEGTKKEDFESWKNNYFKESISGDFNKLQELLSQVRDSKGLKSYQKKFVEDNWNIQMLRNNANIDKASKEIRKQIRAQLDKNNPSTSIVNHLTATIEPEQMLTNIYIKLNGYGGLKGDLHRKYIAALIGGVQVGSGANTEDVIFNEKEYSILISTRFNARWGDVILGEWTLKEDDPQRYLSDAELNKMQNGSPEERDVLRRRVVMESISKHFDTRAFVINVVDENGTIYHFGWDLASSLKAAYTEGKLVVRTKHGENSEAMINDKGEIIPLIDLNIHYVHETGEQNETGEPETEEIEFMQRRNGNLFLTASLNTIKEAANALQGVVFKETPYRGNPSDLKTLQRCVYSSNDLLMRTC